MRDVMPTIVTNSFRESVGWALRIFFRIPSILSASDVTRPIAPTPRAAYAAFAKREIRGETHDDARERVVAV